MAAWTRRFLLGAVMLPLATACAPPPRPAVAAPPPARELSAEELVAHYNSQVATIQSLQLNLDIGSASLTPPGLWRRVVGAAAWVAGRRRGVGGRNYTTVQGFLLLRKPAQLRLLGTRPLVGGRAFDLASDGDAFEVSLPTSNEYITGRNDCVPAAARTSLERLRPAEIFAALPAFPLSAGARVEMEAERKDAYRVWVDESPAGGRFGRREMTFSRTDLRLDRQVFYNARGARELTANYRDYGMAGAVEFPGTITMDHPGVYALLLELTQPAAVNAANPALGNPETFALTAPRGARIISESDCGGR